MVNRLFVMLTLCVLMQIASTVASAKCERLKLPTRLPNTAPSLDGPVAFGPLQDTVTLDCLTYVGSKQINGKEHVQIRDERGTVHLLQRGGFMGENTGMITSIDKDNIYVKQVVNKKGEWVEETIIFPKRKK
jgi:hypothetical protein